MAQPKDQRAAERFTVNLHASCDFVSPVLEDFGPVRIKNVSSDGIGLITSEPLVEGLLLAINLVNPMKKFSKTVLARVVHVTPQSGATYLVGCSFLTPLSYEDVCALIL